MSSDEPAVSVIIPAYDEARVIDRCLEALDPHLRDADPPIEVIVVPNGCHDDTAARARRHPHVRVVELTHGNKAAALDAGDAAARGAARVYLDADIRLDAQALPGLVDALCTAEAVVAAPDVHFDLSSASAAVRAFYAVFTRLPYVDAGLVGLGVYGLSAAGRARFAHFSGIIADDLFVQRHFAPRERLRTPGRFTVEVPRDLRSLLAVRIRVARGNAQLAAVPVDASASSPESAHGFAASTGTTLRALLGLVTGNPRLLPAALLYTAVTVAARRAARVAGEGTAWERDESSR